MWLMPRQFQTFTHINGGKAGYPGSAVSNKSASCHVSLTKPCQKSEHNTQKRQGGREDNMKQPPPPQDPKNTKNQNLLRQLIAFVRASNLCGGMAPSLRLRHVDEDLMKSLKYRSLQSFPPLLEKLIPYSLVSYIGHCLSCLFPSICHHKQKYLNSASQLFMNDALLSKSACFELQSKSILKL